MVGVVAASGMLGYGGAVALYGMDWALGGVVGPLLGAVVGGTLTIETVARMNWRT
jgi:hypothetical protein